MTVAQSLADRAQALSWDMRMMFSTKHSKQRRRAKFDSSWRRLVLHHPSMMRWSPSLACSMSASKSRVSARKPRRWTRRKVMVRGSTFFASWMRTGQVTLRWKSLSTRHVES